MKTKLALAAALMLSITMASESFAKGVKPTGIAGVVYGVTLGVPIKIAKEVMSETKRMTVTLESDFDAGGEKVISQLRGMIYFMSVPYGLVSGSILGSVHGVGNAFKYGYGQPFSKASIGLNEEEVAMKTMP